MGANYKRYRLVPSSKAIDPILDHTLVANPDFSDLDALSAEIERGALSFIHDLKASYLSPD